MHHPNRTAPLRLAIRALAVTALAAAPAAAQGHDRSSTLDTIRVTSRTSPALASATRSVEVLTHDDLERRAARSLAEALTVALGVDVGSRSPAQADLSLRGSTFNQVVVLVDGVRVSDAQSGHYALDLALPLAMIERVEILRGTGSALYGPDAIGGIVNVVTRRDAGAAYIRARGGSFGTVGMASLADASVGEVLVRGGADVERSDGHRPGTDYRVTQLRAGAERAVSMGRVVADVGFGLREFGAADFYSPFPSYETTRSTTAALRLEPAPDARFAVSAAVHARRHGDVYTLKRDDPAFYQNAHVSWQTGAEGVVRAAVAPELAMSLGGELADARLRSARLGDHEEQRGGVFSEAILGHAGGAIANVGVRGDWMQREGSVISPSVGVALPVGQTTQLRASGGRGFRKPTWTERYYRDPANIGDSTLRAETFWAAEVGARVTPAAWGSADVALFTRRATALIDWARPDGAAPSTPWRTMNFGDATYRGVEAMVSLPSLLGVGWTVRGSGLRFDAGAATGTIGKYALRPITRTLGLSAVTPLGASGSLTVDALRSRRAGERDHLQLDARANASVGGVRWSLELVNLSNADYLDGSGKPTASRSVFVGASWGGR